MSQKYRGECDGISAQAESDAGVESAGAERIVRALVERDEDHGEREENDAEREGGRGGVQA